MTKDKSNQIKQHCSPGCPCGCDLPTCICPVKAATTRKVYIAGPMSGIPDFNFPAFFKAEERLRALGWDCVNPAAIDVNAGFDPATMVAESTEYYRKRDFPLLVACAAIAMLPGWEESEGAKDELLLATMCGLEVLSADTGSALRPRLGLVRRLSWKMPGEEKAGPAPKARPWPTGDALRALEAPVLAALRGDPITSDPCPKPWKVSPLKEALRLVHTDRGAAYGSPREDFELTGILWGDILRIGPIPPRIVALMMVALKLRRELNKHGRDNLVDMAGYVETLAMIEGEV